jgi:hypothetical protein
VSPASVSCRLWREPPTMTTWTPLAIIRNRWSVASTGPRDGCRLRRGSGGRGLGGRGPRRALTGRGSWLWRRTNDRSGSELDRSPRHGGARNGRWCRCFRRCHWVRRRRRFRGVAMDHDEHMARRGARGAGRRRCRCRRRIGGGRRPREPHDCDQAAHRCHPESGGADPRPDRRMRSPPTCRARARRGGRLDRERHRRDALVDRCGFRRRW